MGSIINDEKKLEISNILLDEQLLKFPIFKIVHDDIDIKINSKYSLNPNTENRLKDLKNIINKKLFIKCTECQKDIPSFEFFIKRENTDSIICNECITIIKEKNEDEKYISFDKYISTCDKHEKNYELFCINCNMNMCSKCKKEHLDLTEKHEFIIYENILDEGEISNKTYLCKKMKCLCEIFKKVSEMKFLEYNIKEGMKYQNIAERLSRENKFAEIIISSFSYFKEKNSLCYELISNFNDINYNKELIKIDIRQIFDKTNDILGSAFHIIMQSPDIIEKKKVKIVPLCHKTRIDSDNSLGSEIRGIIELKGGYYLAGSKEGIIGIFDSEKLELKQNFRIKGINKIFHMEKIKDENSDLIAIASDSNEIIIISLFPKEKDNTNIKDDDIFEYKFEFKKEEHTGKINRIIQLTNGLIVSSSEDQSIIFWQIIKNDKKFSLQSISKIKTDSDIHILIECPYTNELICNNKIIDLDSYTFKKVLKIHLQDKSFNCQMCLFKEKYLAYVLDCEDIGIINIETGRAYYIKPKYDYVEAVYSIDNETICLCTQDLYNLFRSRYSQQFKLEDTDFVEIGEITNTGTCNSYIIDSQNNFVMGDMAGELSKYCA